jgi:aryl-alcohol dehydrogenase-like predicted oxidoreductase
MEAGVPVDVSSQPARWGEMLRGSAAPLLAVGPADVADAVEAAQAGDLVQAHLIQTLCSIGRPQIDFYFLRFDRRLEEFQAAGALEALELARQDGLIRHLGLCVTRSATQALSFLQLHDAFEVIMLPSNHYDRSFINTIGPLAKERRVGLIGYRPLNWGHGIPFFALPQEWRLRNLTQSFYGLTLAQAVLNDLARQHTVLVGVRSAEEVRQAIEAPVKELPEGLEAMLDEFRQAFKRDETWLELLEHADPELRNAAARRLRDPQRV